MALAYLAGSIPTGFLLVKYCRGVDIRKVGSGNIGATNVKRIMGKGWAVFVTAVDMLKGAIGLLGASASGIESPWLLALVALAGVIGHNFPIWLKFKGGKGVATSYGVLFFLYPPVSFAVTLMSGAVWYALMRITRYVSIASISSLYAASIFFLMLGVPAAYTIAALALAVLTTVRHNANIKRLIAGTESKI